MKPIYPLMKEHRLIEKMVKIINEKLEEIKKSNVVEPNFIEIVIDFFRTYADKCHHGKEENILFRHLAEKQLSPEHQKMMKELIEEHVYARKTVNDLESVNNSYLLGEKNALVKILEHLLELSMLYPVHIKKEERQFFFPCLEYFNQHELENMLQEFWIFDRKQIHEQYQKILQTIQKRFE